MYGWTVIVTPQKTLYKIEVLIDQTFPRYNTLHPKGQHKVLLPFRKHTTIFYLTAFMKNLAIIKIITNDTSDSLLRSLLYLVLFILSTPVRSQDLVGTIELHHVLPKYINGFDDHIVVPIDAAYHQKITNEFRRLWGYGKGPVKDNEYLNQIIKEVYDKYPLPPF